MEISLFSFGDPMNAEQIVNKIVSELRPLPPWETALREECAARVMSEYMEPREDRPGSIHPYRDPLLIECMRILYTIPGMPRVLWVRSGAEIKPSTAVESMYGSVGYAQGSRLYDILVADEIRILRLIESKGISNFSLIGAYRSWLLYASSAYEAHFLGYSLGHFWATNIYKWIWGSAFKFGDAATCSEMLGREAEDAGGSGDIEPLWAARTLLSATVTSEIDALIWPNETRASNSDWDRAAANVSWVRALGFTSATHTGESDQLRLSLPTKRFEYVAQNLERLALQTILPGEPWGPFRDTDVPR
jgi:hypothetical protein